MTPVEYAIASAVDITKNPCDVARRVLKALGDAGYCCVPIEPTADMLAIGPQPNVAETWRAMVIRGLQEK